MRTCLIAIASAAALLAQAPVASAMPLANVTGAAPEVTLVYGGCGPFGHRGPYGGCRTGGQFGGYVRGRSCPPGFHIGPYGRRCQPNGY